MGTSLESYLEQLEAANEMAVEILLKFRSIISEIAFEKSYDKFLEWKKRELTALRKMQ